MACLLKTTKLWYLAAARSYLAKEAFSVVDFLGCVTHCKAGKNARFRPSLDELELARLRQQQQVDQKHEDDERKT